MLGLLLYKWVFSGGDFVAKGKDLTDLCSPSGLSLDHHDFVILSGLKAFRLQKTGIAVYILYIHTN